MKKGNISSWTTDNNNDVQYNIVRFCGMLERSIFVIQITSFHNASSTSHFTLYTYEVLHGNFLFFCTLSILQIYLCEVYNGTQHNHDQERWEDPLQSSGIVKL